MNGDRIRLPPTGPIAGSLSVPGDKSIAHRALLLGSVAQGESRIRNLPNSEDVEATRSALTELGVKIRTEAEDVLIEGHGFESLDRTRGNPCVIDCGNSGTTARLLLGLLAGRRGSYRLCGDSSLSSRPMQRVALPLRSLGAQIEKSETLPLTLEGRQLVSCNLSTGVPSAQVKGALMLAALQADGVSQIEEARSTRDHTERILRAMSAPVEALGPRSWRVQGGSAPLRPLTLDVPGDPSSASVFVAIACGQPGSDLTIDRLSLNPSRLGFFRLLQRMGAQLSWRVTNDGIEPLGTLDVHGAQLSGITVTAEDVAAAIDEIPLLAIIAAKATGPTVIRGASELRVKETDRLDAIVRLLRAFGATVELAQDSLSLRGGDAYRGAEVDSRGDHRVAMCAAAAACLAASESTLTGASSVAVSYPDFFDDLARLTS